jgi:hypothetical protein
MTFDIREQLSVKHIELSEDLSRTIFERGFLLPVGVHEAPSQLLSAPYDLWEIALSNALKIPIRLYDNSPAAEEWRVDLTKV